MLVTTWLVWNLAHWASKFYHPVKQIYLCQTTRCNYATFCVSCRFHPLANKKSRDDNVTDSFLFLPWVLRNSCLALSPQETIFTLSASFSAKVALTAFTKLEWIPPQSPRSEDITTIKLLGLVLSASLGVISTFSYKAGKENWQISLKEGKAVYNGLWSLKTVILVKLRMTSQKLQQQL